MAGERQTNCINMFTLFFFFIFHTIIFHSILKSNKCIKVKNKYIISNRLVETLSDNINTCFFVTVVLWFIWFAISDMFCIFPAISLPHAFKLESTVKGLCHFSFSDVFQTLWNLGACLLFWKLVGRFDWIC